MFKNEAKVGLGISHTGLSNAYRVPISSLRRAQLVDYLSQIRHSGYAGSGIVDSICHFQGKCRVSPSHAHLSCCFCLLYADAFFFFF